MADSVLLRCRHCSAVNRVPVNRITERPKCGKCKAFLEFPAAPVEVTSDNFEQEVLKWPGAVLVEFWTPRCGVCSSVRPYIEALAHRRRGILKVAMVNIDKEQILSSGFNIKATPKFLIYRNGIKIRELDGALPELQMEQWVNQAAGF